MYPPGFAVYITLGLTHKALSAVVTRNMDLPQTLASIVRASITTRTPPILVALCGWADTGKSTVASQLCDALFRLGTSSDLISTDSFMMDRAERNALGISGYDPLSIDINALESSLSKFSLREKFTHFPYDNGTGTKQVNPRVVEPCDVLVVEGIHSFHPGLAKRMNLKVFFDSDEATLRKMRYLANMQKRGMNAASAKAKIQNEWQDYCVLVRPLITSAELVVHVDERYNYRWLMSSVNPGESSNLTPPKAL
jgi:uridine kinase